MTETTRSKSPSLADWVWWLIAVVVVGKVALALLIRLFYEMGLLDTILPIVPIVAVLAGFVAVVLRGPTWGLRISGSLIRALRHASHWLRNHHEDTASSPSQSPANRLPNADARVAHEFSDGREIVPQPLAVRDEIEYELEKEQERNR